MHLLPIVAFFRRDLLFAHNGFVHLRLRAFDPAGGIRLLGDMHANEQIHIRHYQRQRIQLGQYAGSLPESVGIFLAIFEWLLGR